MPCAATPSRRSRAACSACRCSASASGSSGATTGSSSSSRNFNAGSESEMGSFRPDPNILKKHPNAITLGQIQEKDRFLGTLLAAAAGESLGAPHEFRKAAEVGVQKELKAGGPWALGEPTDDIELTLSLLRSLVV